ncbi:MAG: tetraacyldisaccharide 4'-kinase [Rhodocyclaceae bacterium]|nr:tetraacyldisaccharide 4'-kinase [Rhodocyclaceae bacterium]
MPATAPRFWFDRGWRACLLRPASALFGALAALRRFAYARGWCTPRTVGVPVIVVGNIAVGGSGKTPVVAWLAAQLGDAGFTPGIISRGYGRSSDAAQCVDVTDSAIEVGDEPLLLARLTGCPVAVGRDRPAAAMCLRRDHPAVDVIISDDGLQHLALARAVEVVVVDEQVLGNRWLLPAGPLRESVGRLRSADLVLTHGEVSASLRAVLAGVATAPMTLRGDHFERLADRRERRSAADFGDTPIHAVAGIGRPQRFFDQLRDMGLNVVPHAFADHHPFSATDLAFGAGAVLLMTEKDAVKCAHFAPPDTWVFPVRAHIPPAALQPVLETLSRHGRQTA